MHRGSTTCCFILCSRGEKRKVNALLNERRGDDDDRYTIVIEKGKSRLKQYLLDRYRVTVVCSVGKACCLLLPRISTVDPDAY